MNKTVLTASVAITFLIVVAAAFAQAPAQTPQPIVYNISFDDYCDGLTLNLYAVKRLPQVVVGGTHNNYDCVGGVHTVGGFKHYLDPGYQMGKGQVLDITFPAGPFDMGALAGQFILNMTNHTWVLYVSTDGVGNYATKTGTFTIVTPGIELRKGPKSTVQP